MSEFKRGLGEELLKKLKQEDLFVNKLRQDVQKGDVFFAIRPGYGSFYLKGSSLFKYDKSGFATHYKFAFVPRDVKVDYIKENDLKTIEVETNFQAGYEKIKERADLYSKTEAGGVAALYTFAPRVNNKGDRYFLVDIEAAFEGTTDKLDKKIDKIDIVLYDNYEKRLLFCEAKHFSNQEIWAKEGNKPKVTEQLDRYDRQIAANKQDMLTAYATAFTEYNQLMGTELNPPKDVCAKCGLLVFGYDSLQEEKIEKLLVKDGSLEGHKYKPVGDIKGYNKKENIETLFNELC